MPAPTWTKTDDVQASREGWMLANYPEAAEIQKDDEQAIFSSDDHVLTHVTARALHGDDLGRRALVLHWMANAWQKRHATHEEQSTPNDVPRVSEAYAIAVGDAFNGIRLFGPMFGDPDLIFDEAEGLARGDNYELVTLNPPGA